jgi:predicted  nucleic acid-binding Zn-ribbon protein
MREDVQTLLRVQEIDGELTGLQGRHREIPRRRATLLEEETLLSAEAEAVRARLKALLLEGRERESEMRTQEDRAARYQGQLAGVSTNKEYASLLAEIKGVKEKVNAAEDRALAILEETAQLRARQEELEREIQRSREVSAQERAELEALEASLAEEIAARAQRRADLAGRVNVQILRKYEAIVRRGRLPALVALRGRACGNCFGTLPLQAASEIHRRGDDPYTCEHCGVILFVSDEAGAGA